ncbi:hypothetical protein A500_12664 [Clostridium sartagoforme AAU1]|uniref:Helix-turn-helix domain-containing protein n=1 Tax=Clostridium sartagoforme AAU1 TaxID=1202534 RepID=R9CB94_9CLOT|nr:helix-turn-helix domain-containing protein [Clostridium sartagoforme]EOR24456.1 hypothetical protein A500_12664 [Clostridium sartagoforme AAU1]
MSIKTTEVYSVEEFALKAGITTAHARQLLREKKLKGIKVGRSWKISKTEVNNYLGIQTDIGAIEKEIYIKELEAKVKNFEMQINTFKNLVDTLGNIVGL